MSEVILKIYSNGKKYSFIPLGYAETKHGAKEIVNEKVSQFDNEEERYACENAEYYVEEGKHIFTCDIGSTSGGKKSRKSRKSRKTRKTRRTRKSRRFRK